MKKIIIACIAALAALSGSAQILRSTSSEETFKIRTKKPISEWNHSGFLLEAGIGALSLSGDLDTDFGANIGWGYRWHIKNGISWEVFKFGMNTGVSNFKESLYIRITSGVRYDSPRLDVLGKRSIYGQINLGYGGLTDTKLFDYGSGNHYDGDDGNFIYEISAGVKLTRKCSLGLFWQNNHSTIFNHYYGEYDSYKWGLFGVKIEYQFR